MKAKSTLRPKSIRSYYSRSLNTRRGLRFAAIFIVLAAAVSVAITALSFAQKQEKVLRAESKAEPASSIERPSKAAPARKQLNKRRGRNGNQDQQLVSKSQEERGERVSGERKPREWRMRRARPFTGDLRQLPQGGLSVMERPELEGPEPSPGFYVPPGQSAPTEPESAPNAEAPSSINAPAPPPSASFEGLNFGANGNGHPPDTVGDVGPTYYIQSINTSIGIFDKATGNLITAPYLQHLHEPGPFWQPVRHE